MDSYVVYSSGPTLSGRVAVFRSEVDAKNYCSLKNIENMFSPSSVRDKKGISKAWSMGDGQYWYTEEELVDENYFEWD